MYKSFNNQSADRQALKFKQNGRVRINYET